MLKLQVKNFHNMHEYEKDFFCHFAMYELKIGSKGALSLKTDTYPQITGYELSNDI